MSDHAATTRALAGLAADIDEMMVHHTRLYDALVAQITAQEAQWDGMHTRLEGLEAITDYIQLGEAQAFDGASRE